MASSLLNPDEVGYFNTARRRVTDSYGIGQAQNAYQRDTAASAFARSQGTLMQRYAQMRDRLPYGYAKRGLLNSGIYQKGLADFAQQKNQAIGDLAGQFQDQNAGFDLAQRQLASVYSGAGMDLDEQEKQREAAVAASLRAAR